MILIDGDILVYRMGFALENEQEDYVCPWVEGYLNEIQANLRQVLPEASGMDSKIFLSPTGKENFRFSIYPEYKGNRTQPKPKYYDLIRTYLIKVEEAEVTSCQEADDAIGIASAKQSYQGCIVTLDKDLRQIPTTIFNPVKKTLQNIKPEEAIRWFYIQLLWGDISDNIPGVPKIGEIKAHKILDEIQDEVEMFWAVMAEYLYAFQELTAEQVKDMVLRNGRLLKIRHYENELWEFPDTVELWNLEKGRQEIIEIGRAHV